MLIKMNFLCVPLVIVLLQLLQTAEAFHSVINASSRTNVLFHSASSTLLKSSTEARISPMEQFERAKEALVQSTKVSSPSLETIRSNAQDLEQIAEQVGIGQASASSGLLNGEWECIYSPEDLTRSSPFFWAFRRAFPENSDQIFSITDAIPAGVKDVGPSIQTIDMNAKTLVSRVKVATLNGLATSIMTTRCTIEGTQGLEGIRLKVETTKPEESTVLQKLGPLGDFLNKNAKPFPSGEALEKVLEGSSEVVMVTTYCDEGLRVSRNQDRYNEIFVWKRKSFGEGMEF